jgi:hypothetical protein
MSSLPQPTGAGDCESKNALDLGNHFQQPTNFLLHFGRMAVVALFGRFCFRCQTQTNHGEEINLVLNLVVAPEGMQYLLNASCSLAKDLLIGPSDVQRILTLSYSEGYLEFIGLRHETVSDLWQLGDAQVYLPQQRINSLNSLRLATQGLLKGIRLNFSASGLLALLKVIVQPV